jgi:DNA-binding LacI/PurR family transcriptional regulator
MNDHPNTIVDIARLAGVSKSTVSRALNDSPLVGAETKQRIREIAREQRFQMSDPARRLSLGQSQVVALVTYAYQADLAVPPAFMLETMSGIASGLHTEGYDLLVIQVSRTDTDWVRRYLQSGRVDGFILLAASCTPQQIQTLVEANAPFVMWGVPSGNHTYCSVSGDNFAGGKVATEHLLRSGRSRIAFLGGPMREPEVRDRYRGYEMALRESGKTVDPALVSYGSFLPAWGTKAAAAFVEQVSDLDGLFVTSDVVAIAAMEELQARGRRVPDDVAVVGYDDVVLASHSAPPLTTIRQNAPLAGRLLAESLIQHLRTGAVTSVSIPAELIVRESA